MKTFDQFSSETQQAIKNFREKFYSEFISTNVDAFKILVRTQSLGILLTFLVLNGANGIELDDATQYIISKLASWNMFGKIHENI